MIESGFILINKEKNVSSQKVDTILKHKYNFKKIGHLGTLDPLACGLLIVGVNFGTRYFKYFDNLDKTYILRIRLGATTLSLDNEGEITESIDCDLRSKEEMIDKLLENYNRVYDQTPPIYSAIKVDGTPLYKYARENREVELKKRRVEIFDIRRISSIEYIDNSSYFDILLHVSKGFYVRSFAKEFGDLIKTPGMAHEIKRIKVGKFDIINSSDIESIDFKSIVNNPIDYLEYKRVEIDSATYKKVQNGIKINLSNTSKDDEFVILTKNNENIAIYKRDIEKEIYSLDLLIKNESIVH